MERGPCGVDFDIKNEINYFLRIRESQGLKAATREVFSDLRSSFNERKRPESAYSNIVYTVIERNGSPVLATENGVIVRDLLDNFVAIQKTEKGRILAEEQKRQWLAVEGVLLSLPDGQEILSFSPRGGRVEEGVALQKSRRQKDKFLVETRILPRITEDEANLLLTNLATSGRHIRNLREGDNSPLFQVVIGEKDNPFDLKNETSLIDHIRNSPLFLRFNEPQLTLPRQVFPQTREINFPWENQGIFQRQGSLENPAFLSLLFFTGKSANENILLTGLVIDFSLPLAGQLREDQRDIKLFSSFLRPEEPRFLPEKREESSQVIDVFSSPKIPEGGVIFEAKKEREKSLVRVEDLDLKRQEISGSVNGEIPTDLATRGVIFPKQTSSPEVLSLSPTELPVMNEIKKEQSLKPVSLRKLKGWRERNFYLVRNFSSLASLKESQPPKKTKLKDRRFKEFKKLLNEIPKGLSLNFVLPLPELTKNKHNLRQKMLEQTFGQAIKDGFKPEVNKFFLGRKPQNRSLPGNIGIEPLVFQLPERPPIVEKVESTSIFLSLGEKQIRKGEATLIEMIEMIFPKNEVKSKSGNQHLELSNAKLLNLLPEVCLLSGMGNYEGLSFNNPQSLSEFDWFKFLFFLSSIREKMSGGEFREMVDISRRKNLKPLKRSFFYPLPLWFEVEPEGELNKIGKVLDNKFPKKIPNSFKSLLLYFWLIIFLTQKDYLAVDSHSDMDIRASFAPWLYLAEKESDSYCLLPGI